MSPPKLRHIPGALDFSELLLFRLKNSPRCSNHILKIQWNIHFLTHHFFDEIFHTQKQNSNYGAGGGGGRGGDSLCKGGRCNSCRSTILKNVLVVVARVRRPYMGGLALMVLTKNMGIFPLLYVNIGDYLTTFEVFQRFHLNLYIEASHNMQKYDPKIVAFTKQSKSNFLEF